MKSLLLIVTLFVLVAVLQAQDDLSFLLENRNEIGRQRWWIGIYGSLEGWPVSED